MFLEENLIFRDLFSFLEFAEVYLMLNHYAGTSTNGVTHRDRFNYLLDQYDFTPGK